MPATDALSTMPATVPATDQSSTTPPASAMADQPTPFVPVTAAPDQPTPTATATSMSTSLPSRTPQLSPTISPFSTTVTVVPVTASPGPGATGSLSGTTPVSGTMPDYGRLPLSFEPNVGQTDSRVRFLSHGGGYSLFLTGTDAVLALTVPQTPTTPGALAALARRPFDARGGLGSILTPTVPLSETVVRLRYLGVNANPTVEEQNPLPGTANYIMGSDPARWHTNIPTYGRVVYHNIYPGVDLAYHGTQGHLEYDWTVAPGANVAAIAYAIDGGRSVDLDTHGDLHLRSVAGTLNTLAPSAYQTIKGQRRAVSSAFTLTGANLVGVVVGPHDPTQPLVIDPVLGYSTYLGGANGSASGNGIAVDGAASAYVVGTTNSASFPQQNAYNGGTFVSPGNDVFVTKFTPDGRNLVYSTYLGGGGDNQGLGIAVNAAGNAYITGFTYSSGTTGFPVTPGAYQTSNGGNGHNDAFVTELGTGGNRLVYSTYLGGSAYDAGQAIALDGAGDVYVAGTTANDNNDGAFPTTPGAYRTTFAGGDSGDNSDGWVAKLKPDGSGLVYSTFLGGSGADHPMGIAVDASGAAYVAGTTTSRDFPRSSSPFQSSYNGGAHDAFVTKLLPDGSNVSYSTYLGAPGSPSAQDDEANAIAVDSAGAAYVVGETSSGTFPTTPGAYQTTYGGGNHDAFVLKLTPGGGSLAYGTLLGGNDDDNAVGIAVDARGLAYVVGDTVSGNFPLRYPLEGRPSPLGGAANFFISALSADGSALRYSTQLGGSIEDFAQAIAVDALGNAYVTGKTYSGDFATANAYNSTFVGGNFQYTEAVVSKITANDLGVAINANGSAAGSFIADAYYTGGNTYATGAAIDTSAVVNPAPQAVYQSERWGPSVTSYQT